MGAKLGSSASCPWAWQGPVVLRRQQLELGPGEVLQLPPQPAVERQDLAFLPGQQNMYFAYRDVYFSGL